MADPKRRDRPKGSELRASLKPKKPVSALPDRFTEQDMQNIRARQKLLEQGYSDEDISKKEYKDRLTDRDREFLKYKLTPPAIIGSEAADVAGSTDPYLSRNEFKEGFYDQPKPPVSYETLKGTAAKPIPNITDTESFADGGSVRGQKNIQVKKKQFRGVF